MMKTLLSLFFATACAETVPAVSGGLADLPLMSRGLIVTAGGLAGVFLVLCLFFATIKLMQKIGK